MTAVDRIDRAEMIRACRLLIAPGGITELRALDATLNGSRYAGTVSGYFDSSDTLADAAAGITRAKGIYIIPNVVSPDLLARACNRVRIVNKSEPLTADHDITRRRWLLIDVDAQRPAGISATDDERANAFERVELVRESLYRAGWPAPILADSGNGWHLLHRIDLPADDGGMVQGCLAALSALHDDERVKIDLTVHNPARIWKLYGTMACKGDSTLDRPHRMARLVEVPATLELVSETMLLALGGAGEQSLNPPSKAKRPPCAGAFDLVEWIADHLPEAAGPASWKGGGQIWELATCPYNAGHKASAYIGQQPSGAIVAGCHHNSCTWDWHELRARFDPPERAGGVNPDRPKARNAPAIPGYSAFPVDVLPEPTRSFVVAGAKAIGCDSSYIALPLLSALAAAIGNTHRIALKRGWTEPAILWTAIVGESGTMKTPAFKLALRAIRKAQDIAWKEHEAARVEWEAEHLRYEAELTAWKRQAAKGRNDAGDPPSKPAPPIARRYIVSDTTTEALAPILLGNPRGVLLARDELAGWFGSFDRYSKGGKAGADSAHWLSMHNGEALTIDRKTGIPPTIHVPSASVSIAGGIQPGILSRAMGAEHHESGMLARLLFAMPPRSVKRWSEADMDAAGEAAIVALVDRLLALTCDADDAGDARPRLMTLTPDGKAAWVLFYDEHAGEQVDLTGDLSAAWSKLEGYAARLALVIHLARWAGGEPVDPQRVGESSIAAGVALADSFKREARRVYASLRECDDDREIRQWCETIRRKGNSVSVREWQRIRSLPTSEDALAELKRLESAGRGRVQPLPQSGRGRPSSAFILHADNTDTDNNPASDGETAILSVSDAHGAKRGAA